MANKIIAKIAVLILILIGVFFFFVTLLCFYYLPQDLYQYGFDGSTRGFLEFLQVLGPYISVLTLSVTIFAIYLALKQIHIAQEANLIPKRIEWCANISTRIDKLPTEDQEINNYFRNILGEIFNFLYKNNPKLVQDQKGIDAFYNRFIKNNIDFFETHSSMYLKKSATNANNDTVFALTPINTIARIILSPEKGDLFAHFSSVYERDAKEHNQKTGSK